MVIRIRISKDRQYNGQKNKKLSTKHTHKTKDRVARTLLKTGGELRCFGQLSSFYSTSGTRRDIFFSKLTATVGHLWNYSVRGGFMHTYKYKYEYLTQLLALFQSNPGSFFVGVFLLLFCAGRNKSTLRNASTCLKLYNTLICEKKIG